MGFADMHIHSFFSDGSYSPEKIITMARARNVSLVSVCDHNEIRGTLLAKKAAEAAGIGYLTGVEIDAMLGERDIHILCYEADFASKTLMRRINHARAMLDGMSVELLCRMRDDGFRFDLDEYEAFPHDPSVGGWKMLEYMVHKGVSKDLKSGFEFYDRYNVTYAQAGFDPLQDVIEAIHSAGGHAVLAHPGVSLPCTNIREFENAVNDIMEMGADGIECYYPSHDRGITQTCLRICRERGKMITAGSDCHGAFNHNDIACTKTGIERIELNGLKYE